MHCYLCDGEGVPSDYVKVAQRLGLAALGFSSHAPLPFPADWVMRREDLVTYASLIAEAQRSAGHEFPVFTGLEIDYVRGIQGPDRGLFPEVTLDFLIGSVHFVRDKSGEIIEVDGPLDQFESLLANGFSGAIRDLVSTYYRSVHDMLEAHSFDVLGHIDLIQKHNKGHRFFDPTEQWYRNEVTGVIEAVEKNGCIVEVNTGALARGHSALYPERWIVEELRRRDIRMMVNSDAHSTGHLGFEYDRAFDLLSAAGYREHWMLMSSGWKALPI